MNPKDYPEIFLVTGKKVDGKKIGMFGDTELGGTQTAIQDI